MTFPQFTESTLPNGLRMVVVESHGLPVLDADLYVTTGSAADPSGKAGLANMLADLLDKGTQNRTARQIAERIEGVGGSVGAGASDDEVSISVSALADQDTLVFSLLSDVALRPTFPEAELQTVRTQTVSQLRAAEANVDILGSRAFARAVYGQHPYGTASSVASVQAIRRADLQAFHRAHFKPGNALLVVAGDVTPARATELARRYFGGWSGAAAPAPALPAPPERTATEVILVHRPGAVQSNIMVGNLGTRPDNQDVFALDVMNQILGGGTDSRLFQILRQQKGWTYGAYSSFDRPRDVGFFQASAKVRTEATDSAVREMLAQLNRIRDEPVSAQEFEAAKSYLLGSYPLRFETAAQIANRVASLRLVGLPVERIREYPQRIQAVTPEDVQRVARQYVHPDRAVVVVVGDATQLLSKVQGIGPVRVVDAAGNPVDAASTQVRASTDRFDGSRLRPMTLAYNVVFGGNAVGNVNTTVAKEGENWLVTSAVQAGPSTQRSETRFTGDLTPVSSKQTAALPGGNAMEIDMRYENGRVKGSAKLPAQMGGDKTFDTEVVAGTRLSGMDSWVLAVADLAEGKTVSLPIFNARTGSVSNVSAKVAGSQSVTVPAGTFDTWKVEVAGGDAPVVLYLRKDLPHVLVKQEVPGQPVTIELQSVR
jgi:zinc protease